MKRITIERTKENVMVLGKMQDIEMSTIDLITQAINQPQQGGFSINEINDRLRIKKVVDITDSGILEFEDADYSNLSKIVKSAKWPFISQFIADFVGSFKMILVILFAALSFTCKAQYTVLAPGGQKITIANMTSSGVTSGLLTNGIQTIPGSKTFSGSVQTGNFSTNTSASNSNLLVAGGNSTGSNTADVAHSGASNGHARIVQNGLGGATMTANASYSGFFMKGTGPIEAASGTHPNAAALVLVPWAMTNGAGNTANLGQLYIAGPPTGVTPTNRLYSMWVESGRSYFDGDIQVDSVSGGSAANNTLTLSGNSASSSNTASNVNVQIKTGDNRANTALTAYNSGIVRLYATAFEVYSIGGTTSITEGDAVQRYICDYYGAAGTVTLPSSPSIPGWTIMFKNTGTGALTIDATGGGSIFWNTALSSSVSIAVGASATFTWNATRGYYLVWF